LQYQLPQIKVHHILKHKKKKILKAIDAQYGDEVKNRLKILSKEKPLRGYNLLQQSNPLYQVNFTI